MDSRLLRTFVTVVDLGGVGAAADHLGYAQSTVSAQLSRLEHELGTVVLDRAKTGAVPNEAGRRLLPHAREALTLDDRLRRSVRQDCPSVRVGALETLASEWLPEILTAFDNGLADPGIHAELSLAVAGRGPLIADLAAGRLDLIFLFDNGVPPPGPCAIVGRDQTVVVAAPEHPLARMRLVSMDALLHTDFLVAEPGCTSHMLADRLGRDLTRHTPIGMITGSFGALMSMAMRGRGVAVLPRLAAADQLDSGELVELRLPIGAGTIHIEARWRSRLGPAGPVVRALVDLATRHSAAEALPIDRSA